jgi:hypothetical protein
MILMLFQAQKEQEQLQEVLSKDINTVCLKMDNYSENL